MAKHFKVQRLAKRTLQEVSLILLPDAIDVVAVQASETLPLLQIWAIDGTASTCKLGSAKGDCTFAIWTGCRFQRPSEQNPLQPHYFVTGSREQRNDIVTIFRLHWATACGKNMMKLTHDCLLSKKRKYECCGGALGSAGCSFVVGPHAWKMLADCPPAVEFAVRYHTQRQSGCLTRDLEVGTLHLKGTLVIRPNHSVALYDVNDRLVRVEENHLTALGALWKCDKEHQAAPHITNFVAMNGDNAEDGRVEITVTGPMDSQCHCYSLLHVDPNSVVHVYNGGKVHDANYVHHSAASFTEQTIYEPPIQMVDLDHIIAQFTHNYDEVYGFGEAAASAAQPQSEAYDKVFHFEEAAASAAQPQSEAYDKVFHFEEAAVSAAQPACVMHLGETAGTDDAEPQQVYGNNEVDCESIEAQSQDTSDAVEVQCQCVNSFSPSEDETQQSDPDECANNNSTHTAYEATYDKREATNAYGCVEY